MKVITYINTHKAFVVPVVFGLMWFYDNWSTEAFIPSIMALPLVIVADALVVAGFVIVFLSFRENSHASSIVDFGLPQ